MKRTIIFFAVVIFLSCSAVPVKTVTGTSGSSDAEIRQGEVLEVKLHGNSSTGYGWSLKSIPEFLKLKSGPVVISQRSEENITGAPDFTVYTFIAVGPGNGEILFENYRPWEKNTRPFREFIVKIKVK